ncbi:MAG: hypothetical protein JWM98_75 [Thermoleophilia bacterium]|nr:hypothetical protein [Thermoleophilia bacterium]
MTSTAQGHTVTTDPSTAHVVVRAAAGGEVIADSSGGHVLHESNIQDRWYLPTGDVAAALEPSDTTSHCPFKGDASYWSVRLADGTLLQDVAWSYEQPLDAAAGIRSEVSFWTDKVTVEVDGEAVRI